jgi:uncharacterized protein (TIGR02145 family)
MCILAIAQTPEYFNYQVVVRDGVSNNPLVNQNVSFRMSILKGSSSGESQYSELHSANTGALGIVNLVIGNGTGKTGNITTIDWGADTYYLQVEIDKTGGATYVEMGTTQLLSVPYALHAKTVASYTETDPVFTTWDKSTDISITNAQINNWSESTSTFLTGITSGQVTTALGFIPYNSTNPAGYTSNTGTVTSVAMSAPVGLTIAGTPITTSGTLDLTLTSGYAIPETDQLFPGFGTTADKAANGNHTHDYSGVYAALVHDHSGIYEPVITTGTASQYWRGDKSWQTLNTDAVAEGANLYYTDARARAAISLTTTGNSGAATFTSGVINIPDYTLSGLGGQPALNGTGLVRMDGTSVSYDNNTYLTSFTETDPNAVLLTGNQTIAGDKTFSGTTTVQTPVNSTDAATKAYVDELKIMILDLQAEIGVTDARDGTHYSAVRIGNQVWMAENLAYLPAVHSNLEFETQGNSSLAGYGVYGYDGSDIATAKSQPNYSAYGVLYNWWAAMDGEVSSSSNPSGVQGACPIGWHLPSDDELTELTDYLATDGHSGTEGTVLKATAGWSSGGNGTDNYGFTALAGGSRGTNGAFSSIGATCHLWSATELDSSDAWDHYLHYNYSYVGRYGYYKRFGFYVRCVRD